MKLDNVDEEKLSQAGWKGKRQSSTLTTKPKVTPKPKAHEDGKSTTNDPTESASSTSGIPRSTKITLSMNIRVNSDEFERNLVNPRNRLYQRTSYIASSSSSKHASSAASMNEAKILTEKFAKKHVNLAGVRQYSESMTDDVNADAHIAAGHNFFELENGGESDSEDGEPQSSISEGKTKLNRGLDLTMPPISAIDDVFDDLTNRALDQGLLKALSNLRGRTLRVGTMCSGTESPMLAMSLINDYLQRNKHDELELEHVFSCEIEPFKQSYIQLNFDPPILFRDVTEFPDKRFACTAFGSEVPIPGELDILVAGSSCVDYSSLNNKRKRANEKGESLDTRLGIEGYAKIYKPRIVILENVSKAPWAEIENEWQKAGYATQVAIVDSKNFYIPQTRLRGYMIGINREKASQLKISAKAACEKWVEKLDEFQRRASSPFTDFILHEDDSRLHEARRETAIALTLEKENRALDWELCRHRYLNYRGSHFLGFARPFTNWQNNGSCKLPDFGWLSWARGQRERIWDTLDINYLRCIGERDYDMQFKIRCLELSQNVDRETDNRPWGMVGCITPSGMPYLTTRGGPVTGREALALQGIPVNQLCLTRETPRQLQDLAGNAMTSTVIGASLLAALACTYGSIEQASNPAVAPKASPNDSGAALSLETILGFYERRLTKKTTKAEFSDSAKLNEIMDLAALTLQFCSCEGHSMCKDKEFQMCTECGHMTCSKCGLNPQHKYEHVPASVCNIREAPSQFNLLLRQVLPLQLSVNPPDLSPWYPVADDEITFKAVQAATKGTLHLMKIRRGRTWTVVFENSHARLELGFQPKWSLAKTYLKSNRMQTCVSAQWLLYAKVSAAEPAGSSVRLRLAQPIARMKCTQSLLHGQWEFRYPQSEKFQLLVTGMGEPRKSWEHSQGLQDVRFSGREVWEQLKVSKIQNHLEKVPEEILGTYEYLPDCGTACGTLHRKVDGSLQEEEDSLFLFLDPSPLGNASNDSLVFAKTHLRMPYGSTRDIIAKIVPKWRPDSSVKSQKVKCELPGLWCSDSQMKISPANLNIKQQQWHLSRDISISARPQKCSDSLLPLLICVIPRDGGWLKRWKPGQRYNLDLIGQSSSLEHVAWILQRAGEGCGFSNWQDIQDKDHIQTACQICAPASPALVWKEDPKTRKIKPFEDSAAATHFEKKIKGRPFPVTANVHCRETEATLVVEMNVITLLHRAHAKLCGLNQGYVQPSGVQWCLAIDRGFDQVEKFQKPVLRNNADDVPSAQPPNFRDTKLEDRQLRSLTWMLRQESSDLMHWTEREIEEAIIPAVGLRIEAKVEFDRQIHGGVLADEVGYGKTATILGLIDSAASVNASEEVPDGRECPGKLRSSATLILTPNNLTKQWYREIHKFINRPNLKVIMISTHGDLLTKKVTEIQEADIVLTSWSIFDSLYFKKLAFLSRARHIPENEGRGFDQWADLAIDDLENLLETAASSNGTSGFNQSFWSAWDQKGQMQEKYEKFSKLSKRDKTGRTEGPKAEINADMDTSTFSEASKPGQTSRAKCSKRSASGKVEENTAKKPKIDPTRPDPEEAKWRKVGTIFPLLHLFSFSRIVVDEFTYIGGKQLRLVLRLSAPRKWILSGTPPLESFSHINNMAHFLGTKLSIDDDNGSLFESQGTLERKMANKSYAEEFRSYQLRNSPAWYQHRYELARQFLDLFVRQNPADISKIPRKTHYRVINLSIEERTTYFEIFQKLASNSLSLSRIEGLERNDFKGGEKKPAPTIENKEFEGREESLTNMIKNSTSPENALLTGCTTGFASKIMRRGHNQNSIPACDVIIEEKENSFCRALSKIRDKGREAFEHWEKYFPDQAQDNPHFHAFLRCIQKNRFGDGVAERLIDQLLGQVATEVQNQIFIRETKHPKIRIKEVAVIASNLTDLTLKLIDIMRSLRFFKVVRSVAEQTPLPPCSHCNETIPSLDQTLIMGLCGHISCKRCFEDAHRQKDFRDRCTEPKCSAPAPWHSAIRASDLPQNVARMPANGSKLEAVIMEVRAIPDDDLILIFVQFGRIKEALVSTLRDHDIPFIDISNPLRSDSKSRSENAKTTSGDLKKEKKLPVWTAIEDFQAGKLGRACILDIESEDAAGWNLQKANRVFFISSMVTKSQYRYQATMVQAIGRAMRKNQTKEVHVYHFLASQTIDVNILQEREGKRLVRRQGEFFLADEDAALDSDEVGWEGTPFEGAVTGTGDLEEE